MGMPMWPWAWGMPDIMGGGYGMDIMGGGYGMDIMGTGR